MPPYPNCDNFFEIKKSRMKLLELTIKKEPKKITPLVAPLFHGFI